MNLFFPLDMDLQNLEEIETRHKNLKIIYEGPEIDIYCQRYIELKSILADIQIIGSKYNLQELVSADGLRSFFEKLKTKPKDPDVLLNHEWNLRGINNFHDWFCALAGVLRGE
jgi:hypothetical protein